MSMNLECDQCDLIQTPTQVTYECFFGKTQPWKKKLTNEQIRDNYIAWIKEVYKNDSKENKEWLGSHINRLMNVKRPRFHIV